MAGIKITTKPGINSDALEALKSQRQKIEIKIKKEISEKILGNIKLNKKPVSDRFYLPVLNINDAMQWPQQPLETRLFFSSEVAYNVCLGNCCGVSGLKAGCCQIDPDDMEHVLGPLDEKWIKDTIAWLKKKEMNVSREDIVIDFEEGKLIGEKFFSGERKAVFMSKDSYPILRFHVSGPRFACKFLSPSSGKCTIYEKRPQMCKDYLCQYVKSNFIIKKPPSKMR